MATQTESSSQHLTAARQLLDELDGLTQGGDGNLEAKANTAVAHAILVLAEQVAAARVMMVSDALTQRASGETAPQAQ